MNGLILINAYSQNFSRQAERMKAELTARGASVTIRKNNDFSARIANSSVEYDCSPDFCVYLDKDKYIARMLEMRGVRLFNSAAAVEVCDDKMLTHIALADLGVPMPDTLPGLLCYDDSPLDEKALERVENTLGYPVVVKMSYGSIGKGVFKADDRASLIEIAKKVQPYPHLFQKYIAKSHGVDMRVIVIGGKVSGGMLRRSNGDFRSNIGLGGTAEKTDVPSEIVGIAERTAAALALDYCGIDFLLGDSPLVCEVNSNAFFDAFEQVTKINVAAEYAEHIIKTMRNS